LSAKTSNLISAQIRQNTLDKGDNPFLLIWISQQIFFTKISKEMKLVKIKRNETRTRQASLSFEI
jgi:hypothetical protein